MVAYYGDPGATARKVDADGWLHTGDLGSMDATGTLRLDGRRSDLIIRGGENISPVSIEDVLTTLPGVKEAVVVGLPDDVWGQVVAAVLQTEPGAAVELEAAMALCTERLSPYKIPVHWFVARDLPLTASGKIQRFRVLELAAEGTFRRLGGTEGASR
jgi:fatty-acyl-CoA synthase